MFCFQELLSLRWSAPMPVGYFDRWLWSDTGSNLTQDEDLSVDQKVSFVCFSGRSPSAVVCKSSWCSDEPSSFTFNISTCGSNLLSSTPLPSWPTCTELLFPLQMQQKLKLSWGTGNKVLHRLRQSGLKVNFTQWEVTQSCEPKQWVRHKEKPHQANKETHKAPFTTNFICAAASHTPDCRENWDFILFQHLSHTKEKYWKQKINKCWKTAANSSLFICS